MKHDVKIPKRLKIGGFDYKIRTNKSTSRGLGADGKWGRHRPTTREILIDIETSTSQVSVSFIHECLHAIDSIYGNACLSERENESLSNGLHQVLEQLGVRFVK